MGVCAARSVRDALILMSLQGPSCYNYVEQRQDLTGPRLPEGYTNAPGQQNSPTFDKTLYTHDTNNTPHPSPLAQNGSTASAAT